MKIGIDAGHGMSNRTNGIYDPGACGNGIEEADIALQWALTGKWILSKAGIDVFLTRDDDADVVPVSQRNEMAEKAGCTRLISIHCNSSNATWANGTETFARFDSETGSNNRAWAEIVQEACVDAMGSKSRGVKSESESQHKRLAIFDFDNGPSCLLEIGFISNTMDAAIMMQRKSRVDFWVAIANYLATLRTV